MNEDRQRVFKVLGQVESAVLIPSGDSEMHYLLRRDPATFVSEAFQHLSVLIRNMGGRDLSGNDVAIHVWKDIAVTAVYALACLNKEASTMPGEPSEELREALGHLAGHFEVCDLVIPTVREQMGMAFLPGYERAHAEAREFLAKHRNKT